MLVEKLESLCDLGHHRYGRVRACVAITFHYVIYFFVDLKHIGEVISSFLDVVLHLYVSISQGR